MKSIKGIVALMLVSAILGALVATHYSQGRGSNSAPQPAVAETADAPPTVSVNETASPKTTPRVQHIVAARRPETISAGTDKLDRLAQIRETFRALAAGDQISTIRAAKQITNEVERETALMTLVTEWTHGELSLPRQRAHMIEAYGLEAGLGFELASQPELALAWANELTDGPGHTELLQALARNLTRTDPAAAFALTDQIPEVDRRRFSDALLGNWAFQDTAAALQWADQIPDPAGRDAALQAIRNVAPTGIGAALRVQDGHPIIEQLVPGAPAALSGGLLPGDRIVAIAQGNNVFVDVQNIPLMNVTQMIRGTPGTPVQLQVVAADAPPNSLPRTVTLYRDQIKFKN
jgi:hypothetical protein